MSDHKGTDLKPEEQKTSASGSGSSRHHHRHHHHHYDGPRSSQAEGLSDDYLTKLSGDVFDTADSQTALDEEEQNLSEEIRRSIEQQLESESPEELSSQNMRGSGRSHANTDKKSRKSRRRSRRRKTSGGRILIRILLVIIILLLALIGGFLYLRYKGEQNLKKSVVETPVEITVPTEEEEDVDETNLVIYNGERYWYNEDVITILCIGVDREAFASPDEMVIGGNGQADANVLIVIDKNSGKISFLNISRDAMVELDRYNVQGQYIDTVTEQLCLSFAFGNGQETSCENTALSVSRLLYGMPINAYAAIDFESIATLNDLVGGVTVPITEEIAEQFPGYEVGTSVTLTGSEAVAYVRSRDTSLLDSNNTRMSRQKQYIIAFMKKALEQIKADPTQALTLFNSVSGNMVTSIKLSEVTYFASIFTNFGFSEDNLTSVKGEVVEGEDGYAEFIPDETALYETVLNLFYIKE